MLLTFANMYKDQHNFLGTEPAPIYCHSARIGVTTLHPCPKLLVVCCSRGESVHLAGIWFLLVMSLQLTEFPCNLPSPLIHSFYLSHSLSLSLSLCLSPCSIFAILLWDQRQLTKVLQCPSHKQTTSADTYEHISCATAQVTFNFRLCCQTSTRAQGRLPPASTQQREQACGHSRPSQKEHKTPLIRKVTDETHSIHHLQLIDLQ